MKKNLVDLHPEWIGLLRPKSGEGITFDCPTCGPSHRLAAYFKNPLDGGPIAGWLKDDTSWERIGGDWATLTIHPSINYPCFHGWIEHGLALDMSESPLVVFGDQGGGVFGPIALSPRQARLQAELVVRETDELFGGKRL